MTLENTIRKIINNNAGLLASYSKAADGSDGFGTPLCQRPRGKFQLYYSLIDLSQSRDMTPADLCPSCASSSSPLCSCLEAYIDYDYYTWYCTVHNGFIEVRDPPLKQLPGHCPSFESLGSRGLISNYPLLTSDPSDLIADYAMFIDSIFNRGPSGTPGAGPNILGPSALSSPRSFQGPTSLSDWQALFNGTHPLSDTLWRQGFGFVRTSGQQTLLKMLFDARCGITEQSITGACCIPENLGGFHCEIVSSEKECPGQFHPGENCQDIGFNNCGSKNKTIRPDRTQLSKALVNALIKNKKS